VGLFRGIIGGVVLGSWGFSGLFGISVVIKDLDLGESGVWSDDLGFERGISSEGRDLREMFGGGWGGCGGCVGCFVDHFGGWENLDLMTHFVDLFVHHWGKNSYYQKSEVVEEGYY